MDVAISKTGVDYTLKLFLCFELRKAVLKNKIKTFLQRIIIDGINKEEEKKPESFCHLHLGRDDLLPTFTPVLFPGPVVGLLLHTEERAPAPGLTGLRLRHYPLPRRFKLHHFNLSTTANHHHKKLL